jgi:hypothetical protein
MLTAAVRSFVQVLLPRTPGGCTMLVNFTHVSQLYDVAVEAHGMDGDAGNHATTRYRATMMCKYVRREMRDLTDDERRRYLEAMEQVAMLPLADGQALYGNKFINLESFAVKHIHTQECSPFHGGLSFITSHAAFTLQIEQALQAIDPSISQPYWDYTLDAFMLGHDWDQSVIFDRDWYGKVIQSFVRRALAVSTLHRSAISRSSGARAAKPHIVRCHHSRGERECATPTTPRSPRASSPYRTITTTAQIHTWCFVSPRVWSRLVRPSFVARSLTVVRRSPGRLGDRGRHRLGGPHRELDALRPRAGADELLAARAQLVGPRHVDHQQRPDGVRDARAPVLRLPHQHAAARLLGDDRLPPEDEPRRPARVHGGPGPSRATTAEDTLSIVGRSVIAPRLIAQPRAAARRPRRGSRRTVHHHGTGGALTGFVFPSCDRFARPVVGVVGSLARSLARALPPLGSCTATCTRSSAARGTARTPSRT